MGNHLKDPGVDGRIILKWIFQDAELEERDWINLIQGDTWRALMNGEIVSEVL